MTVNQKREAVNVAAKKAAVIVQKMRSTRDSATVAALARDLRQTTHELRERTKK